MTAPGSISALIARLRASGASPEMIADVLDTFAARIDQVSAPEADRSRSAAAERQARYRVRKASQGVTRDVTERDSDVTRYAAPLPPDGPPSPSPTPPSHNPPLSPPSPATTARGRSLPADWQPIAKHFDFAAERGLTRSWVVEQAVSMREWAEANRNRAIARKADWNLTFLGWLRREAGRAGGSRGPPGRAGKTTNADLAREYAERIRAKQNGQPLDDQPQEFGTGDGDAGRSISDAPLFERSGLERQRSGPILDLVAGSADRH